jgi:hypothetical protein
VESQVLNRRLGIYREGKVDMQMQGVRWKKTREYLKGLLEREKVRKDKRGKGSGASKDFGGKI